MALQTIKVILASAGELAQEEAHLEKMMMRTNGERLQKGMYIKSEVVQAGADLAPADIVVLLLGSPTNALDGAVYQSLQEASAAGKTILAYHAQGEASANLTDQLSGIKVSAKEYPNKEALWELLSPELDRWVEAANSDNEPPASEPVAEKAEETATPAEEPVAESTPESTPAKEEAVPATDPDAGLVDTNRKAYAYYPCEELPPVALLGQARIDSTTFKEYYHKREHDQKMRQHYDARPSAPMLVSGNAQSGKSRAVYELLNGEGNVVLCVPNMNLLAEPLLPKVERYEIPVIYLDNLELALYPDPARLAALVKAWQERGIKVIATLQKGEKMDRVQSGDGIDELWKPMTQKANHFEIPQMRWGEAMKVKSQFKKGETPYTQQEDFDGNVGSIFINMNGMRQQYLNLEAEEEMPEAILYAIKVHYFLGNYETGDPGRYSVKKIQEFVRRDWEMEAVDADEWKDALAELSKQDKGLNFVTTEGDYLLVEETFLDFKKKVIAPESTPEGAQEMVFQDLYPEKADQETWGWL